MSSSCSSDITISCVPEDSESELVEKALGVHWLVSRDLLRVMPDVSYGGNKRRGKSLSLLPYLGDIERLIPLKLKLRDCLSVHARCYDPLGLVLPVKMKGNLLFRTTLQSLKLKIGKNSIPWDEVVPVGILDQWLSYFEMLDALKDLTFSRSLKPHFARTCLRMRQ